MENFMKHYTKTVFAFIAAFTLAANTAEAQIVCNKFNLVTKVTGSTLELSVDTDLPDNTVVMVSVSRSYLEKGNAATYSVDYFSEKSTVGTWKLLHIVSIDSDKWKSALREKQEKMSRLGHLPVLWFENGFENSKKRGQSWRKILGLFNFSKM